MAVTHRPGITLTVGTGGSDSLLPHSSVGQAGQEGGVSYNFKAHPSQDSLPLAMSWLPKVS